MDKTERFVELLTRYQQQVYLFILSLLPHRADADEVLQETNLVLWRKFDEFQPGTSFKAWAFQIAYYKVQSFLEKQNRDRLRFNEEFLERVAAMAGSMPDNHDARREALRQCLNKLLKKDRDLVRCRYRHGGSVKAAAEELGRTTHAIYKALARVRQILHECVRTTLAAQEHVRC